MSSWYNPKPRRTRVYNANYNIGQSYYKSTIDELDRKYNPTRATSYLDSLPASVTAPASKLRFNVDDSVDEDLQAARARAHRAITEDSALDCGRLSSLRSGLKSSSAYENELEEDIQASLSRLRAQKKKIANLTEELDLEDQISNMKKRTNLELNGQLDVDDAFIKGRRREFNEKCAEAENNIGSTVMRARTLKVVSRKEESEPVVTSAKSLVSSFKRNVAITDSSESAGNSAASLRANATKARLADMESEMNDRSDRLLLREKRAANLKKFLGENDIEEVRPSRKMITF